VKPAAFEYHRAESVEHALALLAQYDGDAQLIAGGQSLTPMLNLRMARPAHLIDINAISDLDNLRIGADFLEIGAMTRHHRLATDPLVRVACPILAEAAGTIGHYAIRQRGTIGGSLSHADPSAQLPLIATLLNADIVLARIDGQRSVPAREFFFGSLVTAVEEGEMIVSVRAPICAPDTGWSFELFTQRHGDFAIVAVGILAALGKDGAVEKLSVALGGIGATPLSMDEILHESLRFPPRPAWRADVVQKVTDALVPDDNPKIPASYRKDLAKTLLTRALDVAIARAERKAA
jgi:carbon-monoxide dehydrogenase medium subunit